MKNIRRKRYIKKRLSKRASFLRMRKKQINYTKIIKKLRVNGISITKLFKALAKRKPLKLIECQLPKFKMPETVKIVITRKMKSQESSIIPIQEEDEEKFYQIPSQQFIEYTGELQLSIAQMKLNSQQTQIPLFVKNYFSLRQGGIESSSIEAINLWYNKDKRLSTWHYDGYDNFLFVLQGSKTIYLLPPNVINNFVQQQSINVKQKSVFSVNNNHYNRYCFKQNINRKTIKCQLSKGQCLFIPRGWWHCVYSQGLPNIAINIWGNSLSKLIEKHQYAQLLRHLIFQISQNLNERVENWSQLNQVIKQQYRRAKTILYMRNLLESY